MEWRKIPGFCRYSVSEYGDVRRDSCPHCLTRERPIKRTLNDDGYYTAGIVSDDGRHIKRTVHTFVALAFLGPRPEGKIICHRDGISTNVHFSNLRYDTYKSNTADLFKHGKVRRGKNAPGAKLTEADIPKILALLAEQKHTQKQIAAMFSVDARVIWMVASGRTWRHVTNGENSPRPGRGWRKLTDQQVAEIRMRHETGESQKTLAKAFGVSIPNVCMIINNKSRRKGFFERRTGAVALA